MNWSRKKMNPRWTRESISCILLLTLLIVISNFDFVDSFPLDDLTDNEIPGEPLNPDDFEAGKKYARDVMLGLVKEPTENTSQEQVLRNIDKGVPNFWLNGRIPYEIHKSVPYYLRGVISGAASEISSGTCIKFIARITSSAAPIKQEKDFLEIRMNPKGSSGCASYVGKQGGKQITTMTTDCLTRGSTMHELMHVIGFEHEHQRMDRDEYVQIKDNYIVEDLRPQFEKIEKAANTQTEYDYGSILHYTQHADCISPCLGKTIEPKKPYNGEIGQRKELSKLDKEKIIKAYKCKDIGPVNEQHVTSSILPGISIPGISRTNGAEDCVDFDSRCVYVDKSECGKNFTWINFNCRKTCDDCDSDSSCRDYNPKCEYWSRQNYCLDLPEYMLIFCQRSCGLCEQSQNFPASHSTNLLNMNS